MHGNGGFFNTSRHSDTIVALSLSIGLGFTQCPEIFAHFPSIIRAVFAENCVALVFVTAVILNLFLSKDKSNN